MTTVKRNISKHMWRTLLWHIRTALSFSELTLNLFSKSDSKPLFKCSFEKKEGVLLWKFDASEYQKSLQFIFENKFPRFAFTKKNHTMAAAASLTQKPSSVPRQRVWFGVKRFMLVFCKRRGAIDFLHIVNLQACQLGTAKAKGIVWCKEVRFLQKKRHN